jgi:exosortase A-associated hydrolase 1/exosortase A-associated hydrolase 2
VQTRPLPEPFQLPVGDSWRFGVLHRPAGALRGLVLHVTGFAEEMNKSRRMVALQSAAFAEAGWLVLQIDLAGCGDSPGEWQDTSWSQWVDDVVAAAAWLRASADPEAGLPLWLWGLRVGALLAAEAAPRVQGPCHCLFWQPVPSGKLALQQFLRLRMAADLAAGENKGIVAQLKSALQAGETVDVAGYRLPPAIAQGLERATLPPPATDGGQLAWIELSPQAEPALLPASAGPLARWRDSGWQVEASALTGPQFWQTTEIETAPGLIAHSLAAVQRSAGLGRQAPAFELPHSGDEPALVFGCAGDQLVGVLHAGAASAGHDLGVVIVVGGPQYRVGSHRQFTSLARSLADAGYPTLRFDVRGMGDATGAQRSFEALDEDIGAAIDALQSRHPAAKRIVLWGLCDGASAALMYWERQRDRRVAGMALANPWVRSATGEARTLVKHYYLDRLRQRSFWVKLLRGGVALQALRGLIGNVRVALGYKSHPAVMHQRNFAEVMAKGWLGFTGDLLLLNSERDLTAQEFLDACASQAHWREALLRPRLERVDLAGADHTFSTPGSLASANAAMQRWLHQRAQSAR